MEDLVYVGVLFMGDGRKEREIDWQIGASS